MLHKWSKRRDEAGTLFCSKTETFLIKQSKSPAQDDQQFDVKTLMITIDSFYNISKARPFRNIKFCSINLNPIITELSKYLRLTTFGHSNSKKFIPVSKTTTKDILIMLQKIKQQKHNWKKKKKWIVFDKDQLCILSFYINNKFSDFWVKIDT